MLDKDSGIEKWKVKYRREKIRTAWELLTSSNLELSLVDMLICLIWSFSSWTAVRALRAYQWILLPSLSNNTGNLSDCFVNTAAVHNALLLNPTARLSKDIQYGYNLSQKSWNTTMSCKEWEQQAFLNCPDPLGSVSQPLILKKSFLLG